MSHAACRRGNASSLSLTVFSRRCVDVTLQGQSPSIRQLIMHSMAEWYMRGEQYDQAKLSRILDVAQDLKVCDWVCSEQRFPPSETDSLCFVPPTPPSRSPCC